uniref:Rhodanese domain-containing protein n=1 Tax=Chromera velia CCMP2878 TaxID=1169474 RepID=A0A0G4FZ36_9ALVE|eukprot:Cvel_19486.t1-p1 / transcript=Cvel_19486.t1 / gene=Cvel_19486 / organism=Chromera_velia_CCMP2878 / gene_product=Centrosomal protein of 41 kDa, putative / transcript_product=Centrosomal protein of 41 kDa, putative / location=Cvel_scaffold1684:3503-6236(-) / protein_length=319 / sequence_SO=supercontig / SO=protein_coding / is_pseudo=false
MQKKIPVNPRYANVEPKINAHNPKVTTVPEKVVVKRRSELFKRIKAPDLAKLLHQNDPTQAESIYHLAEGEGGMETDRPREAVTRLGKDVQSLTLCDPAEKGKAPAGQMPPPRTAGQVSDAARSDAVVCFAEGDDGIVSETELMLLDLRDPEEFKKGHIDGATNFPLRLVTRDAFTPEMVMFKVYDKMLVVYHTDDKQGAVGATLFAEKGWDNTFLLSGGIETCNLLCPEIVQGDAPVAVRPKTGASAVSGMPTGAATSGSRLHTAASRVSGVRPAAGRATGTATGKRGDGKATGGLQGKGGGVGVAPRIGTGSALRKV